MNQKINNNSEGNAESPQEAPRKQGPIITWLVCAACVAVFIDISQGQSSYRDYLLSLTSDAFPVGNYWGLITSVFVHLQLWHLFFNIYWLWILGGILENAIGRAYWIGFFLLSAIVSSGAQLGFTGSTGIGASGVVYAMFGFIWVAKERYVSFQRIATKENLILFLGWLLLCLVATWLNIMRIGNAAHIAGLLFGAGVASILLKKKTPQLSTEKTS